MVRGRLFGGLVCSLIGAFVLSVAVHADTVSSTAVADAAMAGDRAMVRQLLQDGADVNSAQGDGMTALHWAAMRGDLEMTEMLLYAGVNLRATTRLGAYTPVMLAARNGHGAVVEALLEAGADGTAANSTGTTPLMMAAASGDTTAVASLIRHGADIHAKEKAMEQTAIMFAAAFNRVDAMRLLIEAGADISAHTKVVNLTALSDPREEAFRQAQAQQAQQGGGQAPAAPAAGGGRFGPPNPNQVAGRDRQFRFNELVGFQGGLTPLLFAARQGHVEAAKALVAAGADINQVSAGDQTSPLLIAVINGHFDLARWMLDQGADPNLASYAGVTPLYGVVNVQWAPKALYPQPRAYLQQELSYLEMMRVLIDKGADVNARLRMKVWYSGYNFDLAGVDEIGATPFWRAAYANDVDAMKLLVASGADPNIPTMRPAGRPRTGDAADRDTIGDISGLPPVPVGGPGVPPLLAAAGVGYGEGFAANSHRYAPTGFLPAIRYLVEEIGADVNAVDHEGNTAIHHSAARGDTESILYLVSKGADVTKVSREGKSTADMANGPVQRVQPFPETLALLMKLGAVNNNKCVSC
jgi:ankyrin repeat protein